MLAMPALSQMSAFYRPWILAILRDLGASGPSKPMDAEARVLKAASSTLVPAQLARVRTNNYIRWASTGGRKLGWLSATPGTWGLTDLGREVLEAEKATLLQFPTNVQPWRMGSSYPS